MARITIEDCMEQVPNRFHLVQMAAIRAKQLKKGARPLLAGEQNKEVVTALREIAAGLVKPGEPFAETSGIVPDGTTPFAETSVTGGIAAGMVTDPTAISTADALLGGAAPTDPDSSLDPK